MYCVQEYTIPYAIFMHYGMSDCALWYWYKLVQYVTYDVIVKYTVQTTLYSSIESFETAAFEHCALRRLK